MGAVTKADVQTTRKKYMNMFLLMKVNRPSTDVNVKSRQEQFPVWKKVMSLFYEAARNL